MIESFAYVGFRSPEVDAWRRFGPEVLGAQLLDHVDGAVAFRFDDRAPRLMVHDGPADEVAYLGWECGTAEGVDEVADRVRRAGLTVSEEAVLAPLRRVERLVSFTDPWGFRHELTFGLAADGDFVPGRAMDGGFVTGAGGLGHIVLIVPDLDAALEFATAVLGFRESDHIEMGLSLRFLHCNERHHTLALAAVPGMAGVHHLMLEVDNVDDVGRALDIVNEREIPLAMTLGRHTNDLMTSFYVRTPSGFEIEYGTGGVVIDTETAWEVDTYDAMSLWGHKPPLEPLLPGILRPIEGAV